MKLNRISTLVTSLLLSFSLSQASVLTELHGTKGQADKELKSMTDKLESIDFTITSKNDHIETHYYNEFKEKNLDLLNFYTIVDKKSLRELLIKNPDFGAYAPFNLLAFKKFDKEEGGDTTWYGHLNSETMLNIIGEKDKSSRKKFTDMMAKVDKLVIGEMKPTATKKLTYDKPLPKQPLLKMVKKIGDVDDVEEYVEEFIMEHDTIFGKNKFIIAGFLDLKFEYDDMELDFEEYDAYWVSSLCHFEFSNSVFNHGSPHAGVFAPCSVYFYIPKGSNELHVGYATVENWIASTGIKDKKQIAYMQKIADDVVKTFKQLGFTKEGESTTTSEVKKVVAPTPKVETPKKSETVVESNNNNISSEIAELKTIILKMAKDIEEIKKKDSIETKVEPIKKKAGMVRVKLPTVPTVPSVIQIEQDESIAHRDIKFSKKVPPGYTGPRYGKKEGDVKTDSSAKVGEVNAGRIAAYLRGDLLKQEDAEKILTDAGFTILTSTPLDKKGKLISIVFTNKELTTLASKKNRGFAASLRLLINKKENQISITNPMYMLKGFMQEEFDKSSAEKILITLRTNFKGLKDSNDMLKFQLLPKYQFMHGLPFYQDMEVIARGDNLLEKIKNNKRVLFSQKLDNGAVLIGVKLAKRTTNVTKKIGSNNAAMLPYPVLIENGEAKMLDPKFYISIMYPKLKMSQFMTIATIPDAMIHDCRKVFR